MIILDVPYKEKDEAKNLGAKWNPKIKKWYIDEEKVANLLKFKKWLAEELIEGKKLVAGNSYIVESKTVCWKCKKEINAVSFATDKIMGEPKSFYFISNLSFINNEIKDIFTKYYKNYYMA